jgi:hypothetical protein
MKFLQFGILFQFILTVEVYGSDLQSCTAALNSAPAFQSQSAPLLNRETSTVAERINALTDQMKDLTLPSCENPETACRNIDVVRRNVETMKQQIDTLRTIGESCSNVISQFQRTFLNDKKSELENHLESCPTATTPLSCDQFNDRN